MSTYPFSPNFVLGCLVFILTSGLSTAFSETTEPASPLSIRSDQMTFINEEQRAVFEGKVFIKRGDVTIQADRAEILFKEGPISSENVKQDSFIKLGPSENQKDSISKIQITGNVVIDQGEKKATSEEAVYDHKGEVVVLTGNPVIQESGYEVTGSKVTIFLDENRSEVEESRVLIHQEAEINEGTP